jgi:hypothetical protein
MPGIVSKVTGMEFLGGVKSGIACVALGMGLLFFTVRVGLRQDE